MSKTADRIRELMHDLVFDDGCSEEAAELAGEFLSYARVSRRSVELFRESLNDGDIDELLEQLDTSGGF